MRGSKMNWINRHLFVILAVGFILFVNPFIADYLFPYSMLMQSLYAFTLGIILGVLSWKLDRYREEV